MVKENLCVVAPFEKVAGKTWWMDAETHQRVENNKSCEEGVSVDGR